VADLILVGSGREEVALKALCRTLEIETAVCFAEQVNPPYAFFKGATIFVLPSRYEGMPNALLEAAAAGLPLVSTPASGGVVDLLTGRPGAWLATDVSASALTNALEKALEDLEPGARFHHGFFPAAALPNA
jgi:glycosyltransferase involved in cell wall biosynthesis